MTTSTSHGSPDGGKDLLFSACIKSRHRRWWVEKAQHPYKQLGGKLQGREFARNIGCKVPELYSVFERIEELPTLDKLPSRFVLKPTRGWSAQNVFLLNNGVNDLDGRSWSRDAIVEAINADATCNVPNTKFIIEEYLTNWDHKPGIPYDYKYYLFGTSVAFIHVIERNSSTNTKLNRHWFLTPEWQPITRRIVESQLPELSAPPIPNCIDELQESTQQMGAKLNMFMRIDMYATTRGAVFGEFTPQPHGGNGYTPWADAWLGSLWKGEEGVT